MNDEIQRPDGEPQGTRRPVGGETGQPSGGTGRPSGASGHNRSGSSRPTKAEYIVGAVGLVCVLICVAITILADVDHYMAQFALRILIAIGAAAAITPLPGFFHIEWKGWGAAIRAGSALGVFTLVMLLNPPPLGPTKGEPKSDPGSNDGAITMDFPETTSLGRAIDLVEQKFNVNVVLIGCADLSEVHVRGQVSRKNPGEFLEELTLRIQDSGLRYTVKTIREKVRYEIHCF